MSSLEFVHPGASDPFNALDANRGEPVALGEIAPYETTLIDEELDHVPGDGFGDDSAAHYGNDSWLTEQEVILIAQNGGPEANNAFAALLRAHTPVIKGILNHMGIPPNDRGDAFQETALKAWRGLDSLRYTGEDGARPWLVTVAKNVARDAHRKGNVRASHEALLDPHETGHVAALAAADDVERDTLASTAITAALAELDEVSGIPDAARLVTEIVINGMSYNDYAERYGVNSRGTVASRLLRAKKHLTPILERMRDEGAI